MAQELANISATVQSSFRVFQTRDRDTNDPTVLMAPVDHYVYGFRRGVHGSMSPDQTTDGVAFLELSQDQGPEKTTRFDIEGKFPADAFDTLTIQGYGTLYRTAAFHTNRATGETIWAWLNPGFNLPNGVTLSVSFT